MAITEQFVDAAPLPTDLLMHVAEHRRAADAAEVEVLRLATLWADAHPADRTGAGDTAVAGDLKWVVPQPGPAREVTDADRVALSEYDPSLLDLDGELVAADEDTFTWAAIPAVAWDAPAAFAAANGMSTTAGKALIRDALVLRHRLPRTWVQVLAGRVPAWRARRIAQVVLAAPADVVEDIDARLAPVAGTIGPIALAHLLDASMLRLHAELRELEQVEALDRRSVVLDERAMNHDPAAAREERARRVGGIGSSEHRGEERTAERSRDTGETEAHLKAQRQPGATRAAGSAQAACRVTGVSRRATPASFVGRSRTLLNLRA